MRAASQEDTRPSGSRSKSEAGGAGRTPTRSPNQSLGHVIDLDLADLTPAAQIVTDALAAAPGAAVAARRGSRAGAGVAGAHGDDRWAEQHPTARDRVALDSLFDLASVTKSFVAVSAARLARRGALALDEPLGALVTELADSASGETPLELLLAHRAGLEAHIKLWLPLLEGRPIDLAAAARVAADRDRKSVV